MADVMTQERSSGTVPHYCPHPGCRWSFVGPKKAADGYLSIHLRVIHKGVDPRAAAVAAADPDAELRALERRQAKAAKKARALGEAVARSPMDRTAPASPSADATPGEGNGSSGPFPSPDAAPAPDAAPDRLVGDRECKTEGCRNRANARYDRGILAGLCWETCVPAARLAMSERLKARRSDAAPSTEDQPAPAIGADAGDRPGAQDGSPSGPVRGDDEPLLSMIRQAARGRRELLEAEQRYLEQLRLLRRHPDYERVAPIIHDAVERL